jgi:hypothetical protein
MAAKHWWIGLVAFLLCPATTCADGGTMRFSKECDGYRITLFTSPTSLRAGVVDFSVLVQSAHSEMPLLDLPVTIHVYPQNDPLRRSGGRATTDAATNKLFQAIQLELAQPGWWHVEVVLDSPRGPIRVETDVEVGPPLPSWIDLGMWISWPAGAIVLFAIHQCFLSSHQRKQSGKTVHLSANARSENEITE